MRPVSRHGNLSCFIKVWIMDFLPHRKSRDADRTTVNYKKGIPYHLYSTVALMSPLKLPNEPFIKNKKFFTYLLKLKMLTVRKKNSDPPP